MDDAARIRELERQVAVLKRVNSEVFEAQDKTVTDLLAQIESLKLEVARLTAAIQSLGRGSA